MQERTYQFAELDTTEEICTELNALRKEICNEFDSSNRKIDSLTKKTKKE